MTDGSTNRHGIDTHGGNPKRCIWPGCTSAVGRYPDTRMCGSHARIIHDHVAKHDTETAEQATLNEQAWRDRNRREQLYIVRVGAYLKIGYTANIENRMRTYPPDSILLATWPGTRAEEAALHRRFAHLRSHGREWYPLAPVILEHANNVVAEHGPPETVDFGARPVQIPRPHQAKNVTYPKGWSGGRSA